MDYSLLRSWLGLPEGPWPPGHYVMLGLKPGEADLAEIEPLVLDRMARLRHHQLRHPELVTEGMNRLAQALICLTDPAARAAYDAELGHPTPPAESSPVKPSLLSLELPPPSPARPSSIDESIPGFPIPTEPEPPDATTAVDVVFEPGLAPPGVEASGKRSRRASPASADSAPYEVAWQPEYIPPTPANGIVEGEVVAPPVALWRPGTRRELFARLALVRRHLAAWQRLRTALGDPNQPLDRPVPVLMFLQAVAELRPLLGKLSGVAGEPGRPGGLVAIVLRQPVVLGTIRLLLPDQRRAVAIDWGRGELALFQEQARLRELVRAGRVVRKRSRVRFRLLRRAAQWFADVPELVLVVLALIVALRFLLRG